MMLILNSIILTLLCLNLYLWIIKPFVEYLLNQLYTRTCYKELTTSTKQLIDDMRKDGVEIIFCMDKYKSSSCHIYKNRFPTITIRPRSYKWEYICDLDTYVFNTLLHELGHFIDFKTKTQEELEKSLGKRANEYTDLESYKEEVKAWIIAKRIAAAKGLKLNRKIVRACLDSYKEHYRECLKQKEKSK